MATDLMTAEAVNEVFNDDFSDFDDPFADKPITRDDKPTLSPRATKRKVDAENDTFGLGLDEEVRIAKKQRPVAKLDEARLLSEPGIPKIRRLIRSKQLSRKLRFKGKGSEFGDAAKLLNYFQLWLDNLYPRAKFADALHMVEKAGHTKRMQMHRCEWINECKPGYKPMSEETGASLQEEFIATKDTDSKTPDNVFTASNGIEPTDSLFIPDIHGTIDEHEFNDPDDDELEALLMEENFTSAVKVTRSTPAMNEDSDGEDDLDAILAEHHAHQQPKNTDSLIHSTSEDTNQGYNEDSSDELDILLAEQNPQTVLSNPSQQGLSEITTFADDSRNVLNVCGIQTADPDDQREHKFPSQEPFEQTTAVSSNNSVHGHTTEPEAESPVPSSPPPGQDSRRSISNAMLPHWGTSEATPVAVQLPSNNLVGEHNEDDGLELETDFFSSSPTAASQE